MKFIHLADAHLDSPFLGLSFLPSKEFATIKNSSEESFKRVIDYAISEKVDLVLIAGDTFDSVKPSPKSQLFFANQIERLIAKKIQTVMILGNHDYMSKEAMLLPENDYFKILGSNEQVETSQFNTENNFPYQVSGFSYQHNHIEKDMLVNFEPKKANIFRFGILHASEKTTEKEQNTYAPFTLRALKDLNYDYFALGHIHLRQTLSELPLIVYSGNLQGRHINERGAKGFYLGKINENTNKVSLDFVATAPIIWKLIEMNISEMIEPAVLIKKIKEELKQNNTQTTLFGMKLLGAQYLTNNELELVQDSDFYQEVSNNLEFDSKMVRLYLEQNEVFHLNNDDSLAFKEAEARVLTDDSIVDASKDLRNKSDYISQLFLDKDYLKNIKELTKVKLGQKLKEFNDDTKED